MSLGPSSTRNHHQIKVQSWRPSLVRRKEYQDTISKYKDSPQMIWTLQNHQRNIASGLSNPNTNKLEDSQHLPHVTLIPILWNIQTQPELLPTTTRSHPRRRRIWSQGHSQPLPHRLWKTLSVSNQMEGIPHLRKFIGTSQKPTHQQSHTAVSPK